MKLKVQHTKICGMTLKYVMFIALNMYIREEKWPQINNLRFYSNKLEKLKIKINPKQAIQQRVFKKKKSKQ